MKESESAKGTSEANNWELVCLNEFNKCVERVFVFHDKRREKKIDLVDILKNNAILMQMQYFRNEILRIRREKLLVTMDEFSIQVAMFRWYSLQMCNGG